MTNRVRTSSYWANFVVACIIMLSAGLLYANFDPALAGEDIVTVTAAPVIAFVDFEDSEDTTTAETPSIEQSSQVPLTERSLSDLLAISPKEITSDEVLRMTLLLMQDGQKLIRTYDNYQVTFHREERIAGDMRPQETIAMKVQHTPHFAVYMKWLTVERGQQVTYNGNDKDGCMTVKLGGLKRLLPAVRLEPTSSMAMEKSRHPITEAGLCNMIQKIIDHRQKDVKRGHGIACRRMADQELNGTDCYCLKFEYESPEMCETYRKSLIMVDKNLNLPILIRNYTWHNEAADNLSDEELDQQTLIENYAFTDLDVSSELIAIDFSPENPKYKM